MQASRPPASRYVDSAAFNRSPMSGTVGYAYDMAPEGHTVAQPPHPAQRWGSTLTWSPSARMAPLEQTSMHLLQPSRAERLWAQIFSRYWKNRGFSNSPTIETSLCAASA